MTPLWGETGRFKSSEVGDRHGDLRSRLPSASTQRSPRIVAGSSRLLYCSSVANRWPEVICFLAVEAQCLRLIQSDFPSTTVIYIPRQWLGLEDWRDYTLLNAER